MSERTGWYGCEEREYPKDCFNFVMPDKEKIEILEDPNPRKGIFWATRIFGMSMSEEEKEYWAKIQAKADECAKNMVIRGPDKENSSDSR